MILYQHPKSLPRAEGVTVHVNGQRLDALHTGVADFAIASLEASDFPARVEIKFPAPRPPATIRPVSKGIAATQDDGSVVFDLRTPEKVSVDFGYGHRPFYFFGNPPETNPPDTNDPSVVHFPAGQITEIPMLTLEDGQTLYLPGGAVLKGRIHIKGKSGIRICGHGIFDGSFYSAADGETVPSIILDRCPDVLVEDITMVRPQAWMVVLAACEGATVRNLKQVGEVMSSDGIDVLGSSNVLIEDCFLHNNDDCVVVKAFHLGPRNVAGTDVDGALDVSNVLVQRCTLANWHCGNAMEIGHELTVERISGVAFRDIDVLHVHGAGAVFSIHNNDRALVEDVLFENIRIEHCYDKLIDLRISHSRYSTDEERGRIRNVRIQGVRWTTNYANAGYTLSVIGGWDAEHRVEDVLIGDFQVDGRRVRSLDELEITTRHCTGLRLADERDS